MKTTIGKEGLSKTWQLDFPETIKCCLCKGTARIDFVKHKGIDDDKARRSRVYVQFVSDLNKEDGYWVHDCCAVAVYFCSACLKPTALYNQGKRIGIQGDREETMEKFWMVWNEGNRGPEKKHLNENSARNEAERLARLNPGQKFYVLAAIDCCQQRDVLWASETEMPF